MISKIKYFLHRPFEFPIVISPLAILWASTIILSSLFMRNVLDLTIRLIGREGIVYLVWVLFGCLAVLFIAQSAKLKNPTRIALTLLVLSFGVIGALTLDEPAEREHIIKFGILGALVAADQSSIHTTRRSWLPCILTALFAGIIVAALDESFQHFIPRRVGDIRDVICGAGGSLWGGTLYSLQRADEP